METKMEITTEMVRRLREKTGAGMMECKKALVEANGNEEEAITILRKRGLAQAARRSGRATAEGLVGSYIHMGGKIGVLLEVNCESDFVARTEQFQSLVKELALHIAAADPKYISREEIPADVLERERAIYRAQFEGSGKPKDVIEKIVEGKVGAFYTQVVLLDQPNIRDAGITIAQMIASTAATLGEDVSIRRFVRFKVGESEGREVEK